MRKRLIQVSYDLVKKIDYFSKDGFAEMVENNNQDIDNTIKELEKDKKNLEINSAEITRKNLFSNNKFEEIAYDDFEGKNPKFSVYNSWENPANFRYIKKKENIAVHLLFLDVYYNITDFIYIFSTIKNNLSLKYIFLFIPMLFTAVVKNIMDILLFAIFGCLDTVNYLLFIVFKKCLKLKFIFKRKKNIFVKNTFLLPFKLINYILLNFLEFMIINVKTLANLINKLVQPVIETSNTLLNSNENFTVAGNITRYQVDREKRSLEHIDLLSQISKQTLQKLQQLSKEHKLNYLKKIDFKEIVAIIDYEKLPDGILKDFYIQKDLQERNNIKSVVATMLLKKYSNKNIYNYEKIQETVEKYNNIEIVINGKQEKINLLKNKNLKDKIVVNDKLIGELSNQLELGR